MKKQQSDKVRHLVFQKWQKMRGCTFKCVFGASFVCAVIVGHHALEEERDKVRLVRKTWCCYAGYFSGCLYYLSQGPEARVRVRALANDFNSLFIVLDETAVQTDLVHLQEQNKRETWLQCDPLRQWRASLLNPVKRSLAKCLTLLNRSLQRKMT